MAEEGAERTEKRRYQHSAIELIRAGFWLSVGALIVFPAVLGIILLVIFSM